MPDNDYNDSNSTIFDIDFYKELVKNSPVASFVSQQGKLIFVSNSCLQMFGYEDVNDVLGTSILDYVAPSHCEKTIEIIKKNVQEGVIPSKITNMNKRSDGSVFPTESKIVNMNLDGDRVTVVFITDTSEYINANIALQESESELNAILDSMQDTYYRVDKEGYVLKASSSVEQLFGFTKEESIKISLADLYVDPDGRSEFLQALTTNNGKIFDYQAEMWRKDGSTVWVSTNAQLYFDRQGEVVGVEGTTRNISDKIKFEKALQESEKRFKAIFNAITDAVIFADIDRRILLINPAVTKIFGYVPSDLKNKQTECLYENKTDYINQGKTRYNINSPRSSNIYEMSYQRKDGTVFLGETYGIRIDDDAGDCIGYVAIVRDVSEQRKNHNRLRLSQKIFENAGKAILVTDEKFNIVDMNNAFCEITGYRKRDVIGTKPSKLLTDQYSESFYANMASMLSKEGSWRGELWGVKQNNEKYPILATINAVKDEKETVTNYVTLFSNISNIKNTEKRLEELAHYDQLTGLPNRKLFHDILHSSLERAKRHDVYIAIMYIDLDGFKQVNDTLGHAEGDKLLIDVAERLKMCVREEDIVARLGGDEFAIIITELYDQNYLHGLAKRIVNKLSTSLSYESREIPVSGSIGVAVFPDDGSDEKKLLQNADQAMYHAKQKGKNTYQFFDAEMNVQMLKKIHLEHDLRHAIKHQEFFVQYQPKFDLQKKKVVGVEALVRWQHPELGVLQPADFISLAEDTSLIYELGKQVLEIACHTAKKWHDDDYKAIPVAVNISTRQIKDDNFVSLIVDVLASSGLPANLLEIEITESLLMDDIEKTIVVLKELKNMGLSISIDDFGTGYSSLSYLKKLPVDTLKIDRSFVMDVAENDDDRAIVSAIISMAKSLNLRVIAEGVESMEQFEFLQRHLCHEIQGYLLTKPVAANELSEAIFSIENNQLLF